MLPPRLQLPPPLYLVDVIALVYRRFSLSRCLSGKKIDKFFQELVHAHIHVTDDKRWAGIMRRRWRKERRDGIDSCQWLSLIWSLASLYSDMHCLMGARRALPHLILHRVIVPFWLSGEDTPYMYMPRKCFVKSLLGVLGVFHSWRMFLEIIIVPHCTIRSWFGHDLSCFFLLLPSSSFSLLSFFFLLPPFPSSLICFPSPCQFKVVCSFCLACVAKSET